MSDSLNVGDKAPAFDLPTDGGGRVRLSDLKGKIVVLYFYPKDDTSGCTSEAISFSAKAKEFAKLGAVIIGVSKDTPASHDKFKTKHGLDVILASAADTDMVERYGVWTQKSMYGRTYMGIERATFIIDAKGKIHNVWRKVKVTGHAEAVAKAVKALTDE